MPPRGGHFCKESEFVTIFDLAPVDYHQCLVKTSDYEIYITLNDINNMKIVMSITLIGIVQLDNFEFTIIIDSRYDRSPQE